ncbi:SMI1/KNR4 family protein [Allorhodopirellula solitaria]|uniref:Uncharacterized protein n=1 Tax=Allorhodopirellula solitaria TaxID=2527987 RepID=A0A5C5XR14_9BACT|nr:SMI1/KNR4 family protein [Allorhodopirellula solitaria]TWT65079.1 hypothetical protein CA85_34240 [Allorhodopirellula solitaria]
MTTPDSTPAASDTANIDDSPAADRRQSPTTGPEAWSKRLADRFALDFGDELNQWWDELCQHSPGPGEFRYPVMPQTLLATVPDPIWPPLMPPNFLPLVGNGAGDWLCLRLLDPHVAAQSGRSMDICHWYHGGGDWLPWGDTLSEALLFDWLLASLPQAERRHAEPASEPALECESDDPPSHVGSDSPAAWRDHRWGQWVSSRMPGLNHIDWARTKPPSVETPSVEPPKVHDPNTNDPHQLAAELLSQGVCEVPIRCQLIIDALASPLGGQITPQTAHDLGLTWNDWMRWCFDLRMMPSETAALLQEKLGTPAAAFDPAQQSWNDVAAHAAVICASHPELSWGHDLLGYTKWSQGDTAGAEQAFSQAIRCSVFTDQSVRFRTHWATSTDGVAKFSARFLAEMPAGASHPGPPAEADRLGCLPATVDLGTLREFLGPHRDQDASSVRQRYSQLLVDQAEASDSPETSVRLLYAAGWDLGAEPMRRYGELLDRYIRACRDAGWTSHERLASVHRGGLKARYNL